VEGAREWIEAVQPWDFVMEELSMSLMRIAILALILLALVACDKKKSAQSLPDVSGNDQSTVYDSEDGQGQRGSRSSELESDDVESDVYIPTINDESIDSVERLDEVTYANLDLDWGPIFFAFDNSDISDTAKAELAERAEVLMSHGNLRVMLEGHCDSRGTEDYNLALGERRAQTIKRYFIQLGVPVEQLKTMSYGEMRPLVPSESEAAWSRNRRVSFSF